MISTKKIFINVVAMILATFFGTVGYYGIFKAIYEYQKQDNLGAALFASCGSMLLILAWETYQITNKKHE